METATPRQLKILRYIRDFRGQHGYSPTMQEIGDYMGLTKVTAFEHVVALVRKKLLLRGGRHKARSLQVCPDFVFEDENGPGRLPLAGRIAAGRPIEAVEDARTVNLEEMLGLDDDSFALQVSGNSMIDEHIADGDLVICRKCSDAANGETVVALLPGGDATLKKLFREKNRVRLQPANPDFKPIYVDNVTVQGVVVGVIRRY